MEKDKKWVWEILDSELAMNHKWCRVRKDKVRFPSGLVDDYFVFELPEVVLVFPVDEKGNVIFVRQYKHGAGKTLYELPGGCFTPGVEAPLDAIQRELREETGMTSSHWTSLGKMYENPTKANNQIHLFLAREVSVTQKQSLDPTEDIEIHAFPLTDIPDMVMRGEICASTSLALIFKALEAIKKEG